jgi:hypothetical protein
MQVARGEAAGRWARRIGTAGARISHWQKLRLIAAVFIPVAMYVALSSTLHSDLAALAITEAIPVAWVLATGVRKRNVNPIVLAVAIVLAAAVLVSIASGGSTLPLKLRRAVITGSLGIACMGSVLVRRPLLPLVADRLARAWPRAERITLALGSRASHRQTLILTAIVGITLLADATAQVTLALSVSTAAFLGASRLARLTISAAGLGACALYLRWVAAQSEDVPAAPESG